jgi:hypothetical protein
MGRVSRLTNLILIEVLEDKFFEDGWDRLGSSLIATTLQAKTGKAARLALTRRLPDPFESYVLYLIQGNAKLEVLHPWGFASKP